MASVTGPRIGKGEIVPRAYMQQEARFHFLASFFELVPDAHGELYSVDFEQAALYSLPDEMPGCDDACLVRPMVRQWQAKYRLTDKWVHDIVMLECEIPDLHQGRMYWDPNRKGPRRFTVRAGKMPHRHGGYHIALYELHEYFEFEDGTMSDDDFDTIGMYDPRFETEDEAVARIMPELERRLRNALRVTELDDRDQGETVRNRALPPARHFDWTVRYQVLGEKYVEIATADGYLPRTVSDAVRGVADLIGLTLREPDKGGRPRKQRPGYRARCIAIPSDRQTPAGGYGSIRKQVFS